MHWTDSWLVSLLHFDLFRSFITNIVYLISFRLNRKNDILHFYCSAVEARKAIKTFLSRFRRNKNTEKLNGKNNNPLSVHFRFISDTFEATRGRSGFCCRTFSQLLKIYSQRILATVREHKIKIYNFVLDI